MLLQSDWSRVQKVGLQRTFRLIGVCGEDRAGPDRGSGRGFEEEGTRNRTVFFGCGPFSSPAPVFDSSPFRRTVLCLADFSVANDVGGNGPEDFYVIEKKDDINPK